VIRLDDQMHESLRSAARDAGVSASEWIRQAVRERLLRTG
jgi:predicted HicB family RNase H-like nuclease